MKQKLFSLNDLNKDFWKKVIVVDFFCNMSRQGWSSLTFITQNQQKYFIGFEGLKYGGYLSKDFFPFSKDKSNFIDDIEYKYISSNNNKFWIRNDYYNDFMNIYNETKENDIEKIACHILKCEHLDCFLLEETFRARQELHKEFEEMEIKSKQCELTKEYLKWQPLYSNNIEYLSHESGFYTLLFKEEEKIIGYQFTIIYQYKSLSPLVYDCLAKIEAYILFEKKFEDVQGNLAYTNIKENSFSTIAKLQRQEQTLNQYEINNPGHFIRVFKTLQEVKDYAIAVCNLRNYVNKENIIEDLDNSKRKNKNYLRLYKGLNEFNKHYQEILNIVCKYDYPSSMYHYNYLFDEIKKETNIEEETLKEMWKYIPKRLERKHQEYIEKRLEEFKKESFKKS